MSVKAGFNATIGVLLALAVVFFGVPILFCAGVLTLGSVASVLPDPPKSETTAPAHVARPVRQEFDPPQFQPDVERIAPGERVWPPPDPKPLWPVKESKPEVDAETAAARKLSLAKSLADPARRKAWLEEIVRDHPGTEAAAQAAELADALK